MSAPEKEDEDLHLGASHAHLIGSVVCLDVDGKDGRKIYAGVLRGTRDEYDDRAESEIRKTTVWVGETIAYLDWSKDATLTARISKEQ